MRPRHLALPARLCAGSAASRKLSELGVPASSHRFSINGLLPQKRREDARTRRAGSAYSKSPATAGRKNTTGENLRKLATASSSCGELRKLSSTLVRISPIPRLSFRAKSRNLSILFPILPLAHDYAALQLLLVGLRSPTPCP